MAAAADCREGQHTALSPSLCVRLVFWGPHGERGAQGLTERALLAELTTPVAVNEVVRETEVVVADDWDTAPALPLVVAVPEAEPVALWGLSASLDCSIMPGGRGERGEEY